ncbi:hypothetical protein QBC39DRAFT_43182 [Podospora conica]|nr:hypothetical protein QBC39DRAFT_43182 [Schizothecium conicum]
MARRKGLQRNDEVVSAYTQVCKTPPPVRHHHVRRPEFAFPTARKHQQRTHQRSCIPSVPAPAKFRIRPCRVKDFVDSSLLFAVCYPQHAMHRPVLPNRPPGLLLPMQDDDVPHARTIEQRNVSNPQITPPLSDSTFRLSPFVAAMQGFAPPVVQAICKLSACPGVRSGSTSSRLSQWPVINLPRLSAQASRIRDMCALCP